MAGEFFVPHTIERAGQSDRYSFVVKTGQEMFRGTAIVDPNLDPNPHDLSLVNEFNLAISPIKVPWEGKRDNLPIQDPSTFDNWEKPGGPLESTNLAIEASQILLQEIKGRPTPDCVGWEETTSREISDLNPYHLGVAAGLHDIGRNVTHLFGRTDLIGGSLLNKIGVRDDISRNLPSEKLMQVPLNHSMDEAMRNMPAEAVIVRIADEFGKRKGGTNRILQPQDFTMEMQEAWADRYRQRPLSGAASDWWMRRRFDRHNANVPRYFAAMDNWLKDLTGKNLEHYTKLLDQTLSPRLEQV